VSEHQQEKPVSVEELLESVRQLRGQDADGFRRLVDEISGDTSLGLSQDVIALAKTLGYEGYELLEAVDVCGLVRTFGFLRREAGRRSTGPRPPLVM
jgi:hypothetical protein